MLHAVEKDVFVAQAAKVRDTLSSYSHVSFHPWDEAQPSKFAVENGHLST